eukprot:jgi/Chlat1/8450/Chrsp80S07858
MGLKVLVTGGSGYLGQFLVVRLAESAAAVGRIALTYHANPPGAASPLPPRASAHKVDLATGDGLQDCFLALGGTPDVVINCAAISQPAACAKDPAAAQAINVPMALVKQLQTVSSAVQPLLIHISTDQVYEGVKAHYSEDDECKPVNEYGVTKLAAEDFIQKAWPRHVILRSSLIIGPEPPLMPVSRGLFVQWIDETLAKGQETTFFEDEFRNFVFVDDIIAIILVLLANCKSEPFFKRRLYNMGGPERLSRLEFARKVAQIRGYDLALVKPASAASINRAVKSPPDISMSVDRVLSDLHIQLTTMDAALVKVLQPAER